MKRIDIVGDNCEDRYWSGRVSGISAEAPVPVVKVKSILSLPGMSGNVARLLQDLGGGIGVDHLVPNGYPTKNRLVAEDGTQLARWDENDTCSPYEQAHWQYFEKGTVPEAIIVSDYGKGSLDTYAVGRLRHYAESGIPLFIDTKMDPFVWLGVPATLFPNQFEFRQFEAHYNWMPSVVHKLGSEGLEYRQYGQVLWRQPAQCPEPLNVCGAGDAVIAAFTWAAVQGGTIGDALRFANACAGQLVSRRFDDRHLSVPEGWGNEGTFEFGGEGAGVCGAVGVGV